VKAGPLVAFEKVDLDEVWRYSGMIQDGDGNCERMVEQLRLQVGEAAEVLSAESQENIPSRCNLLIQCSNHA
jgi:hypothetical protein